MSQSQQLKLRRAAARHRHFLDRYRLLLFAAGAQAYLTVGRCALWLADTAPLTLDSQIQVRPLLLRVTAGDDTMTIHTSFVEPDVQADIEGYDPAREAVVIFGDVGRSFVVKAVQNGS